MNDTLGLSLASIILRARAGNPPPAGDGSPEPASDNHPVDAAISGVVGEVINFPMRRFALPLAGADNDGFRPTTLRPARVPRSPLDHSHWFRYR